jgi:hypothetical protein
MPISKSQPPTDTTQGLSSQIHAQMFKQNNEFLLAGESMPIAQPVDECGTAEAKGVSP